MALCNSIDRRSVQLLGTRATYGEYPVGEFRILAAFGSSKISRVKTAEGELPLQSTWLSLTLMDESGSREVRGDIRDFANPLDFLNKDNTFRVTDHGYRNTGDKPEFIPLA